MNRSRPSFTSRAATLLAQAVPAEAMRAFRFYFAAHVFLQTLKLPWNYPDSRWVLVVQGLMLAAALVTLHRRWHPAGIALLLAYKGYWVVEYFPMTGNHFYAELLVLLLLLVFPDRPAAADEPSEAERRVDGTPAHLIQLSVLSIYFYSGLQKIFHGMWLDGEFLALSLFHDRGFGMWRSTRWLIDGLAGLFGSEVGSLPLERAEGFATQPFDLPGWIVWVVLLMSWTIVGTEVGVPLLFLSRRTRGLGIWTMLVLQVGIGIYAWETEFMFGAVGAILLFFHRHPWRNYLVLLALHVAWSVFVVAADLRIWEL